MFLRDSEGRIIPKYFKIWKTLFPFGYSKIKGIMPRVHLTTTANIQEYDFIVKRRKVKLVFNQI